MSRAYSGKTMRVVRNAYTEYYDAHPGELKKFPEQLSIAYGNGAMHLGGDSFSEGVDVDQECYPAGQGVGGDHRARAGRRARDRGSWPRRRRRSTASPPCAERRPQAPGVATGSRPGKDGDVATGPAPPRPGWRSSPAPITGSARRRPRRSPPAISPCCAPSIRNERHGRPRRSLAPRGLSGHAHGACRLRRRVDPGSWRPSRRASRQTSPTPPTCRHSSTPQRARSVPCRSSSTTRRRGSPTPSSPPPPTASGAPRRT